MALFVFFFDAGVRFEIVRKRDEYFIERARYFAHIDHGPQKLRKYLFVFFERLRQEQAALYVLEYEFQRFFQQPRIGLRLQYPQRIYDGNARRQHNGELTAKRGKFVRADLTARGKKGACGRFFDRGRLDEIQALLRKTAGELLFVLCEEHSRKFFLIQIDRRIFILFQE